MPNRLTRSNGQAPEHPGLLMPRRVPPDMGRICVNRNEYMGRALKIPISWWAPSSRLARGLTCPLFQIYTRKKKGRMVMKNSMLTLLLCITAVAGYAASLSVTSDYDTAANFDAMKTFDWMPATGNAAGDELLVKRIRNSVDTQLQAKGRKMAADNPDFLIGMELSGKTITGSSTGVGVSVGIPVGRRGRVSVGGGKSKASEKKEGTLIIDFVDAKTKSLVWRATATDAVDPSASAEEKQKKIDEVIAAMLAQFPPKKK